MRLPTGTSGNPSAAIFPLAARRAFSGFIIARAIALARFPVCPAARAAYASSSSAAFRLSEALSPSAHTTAARAAAGPSSRA